MWIAGWVELGYKWVMVTILAGITKGWSPGPNCQQLITLGWVPKHFISSESCYLHCNFLLTQIQRRVGGSEIINQESTPPPIIYKEVFTSNVILVISNLTIVHTCTQPPCQKCAKITVQLRDTVKWPQLPPCLPIPCGGALWILGAISVQLQLQLATGTELDNKAYFIVRIFCPQGTNKLITVTDN